MDSFLSEKTVVMATSGKELMQIEGENLLLVDNLEQIDTGTYKELKERQSEIMQRLHVDQVKLLPQEEEELPRKTDFGSNWRMSLQKRPNSASCYRQIALLFRGSSSHPPPAVNKETCHLCLCAEPHETNALCQRHSAQEQLAKEIIAQTTDYANDEVSVGVRTWMHFVSGHRWAHYSRFLPLVILAYLALVAFTFVENMLTEPALAKFKSFTLLNNQSNQSIGDSAVNRTITLTLS